MTTNNEQAGGDAPPGANGKRKRVDERIIEIVSDSGEGAQKAGQSFATVCGKMGNGVWTVEIIPAEIQPPARSRAGASGIRVRFGSHHVTNMGDEADMVVAFNEQVLYGRITQRAFKPGTVILLENKWATDPDEKIREQYQTALDELNKRGYVVKELALEQECLKHVKDPKRGKNMFVLGMLCQIFGRQVQHALDVVAEIFKRKAVAVVEANHKLVKAGYEYAMTAVDDRYEVPPWQTDADQIVMNGNTAVGMGVMAAGIDCVAMYPITPATSASHYLGEAFYKVGGHLHQAEDEIAAMGYAIGASYAGQTTCTITSGPGLALKTEFLGLAVMCEVPLVLVLVQRGGPSTGLPTKVEQGDLLASLYGATGDAPKIVMAAATIEECLHFVVTARKLAEAYRGPVLVLTDANLATGVQGFPRPKVKEEWFPAPLDQSPWKEGVAAYEWDEETGLSPRPIPGMVGGEYVLTGLAHTKNSKVAYDPTSNQLGCDMRSRKLAALQRTLTPPEVHGDSEGDLLVVGWGSTLGAIDEAVDRVRAKGKKVSSLHLRFLSPMEPGLKEIFSKFKKIVTVEINYSDAEDAPLMNEETRRLAQLAWLLRGHTRMDIDCWSNVYGQPMRPMDIEQELMRRVTPTAPAAGKGKATNVRAQV